MNKWLVIAIMLGVLQILVDITKDWSVLQSQTNPIAYIIGANILLFGVAFSLYKYSKQRKPSVGSHSKRFWFGGK